MPNSMKPSAPAVEAEVVSMPVETNKPLSPYQKALNYLLGLSPQAISELGKKLFPEDKYQRIVLTCYIRTVQNADKPHISPRSYVPNLIGAPGQGKTAIVHEVARKMKAHLDGVAGGSVDFRVITRTLAGVNDFSTIIGVEKVVETAPGVYRTILAPRTDMPVVGDEVFAMVFIDDFNRGHDFVQSGCMELVNTLRFNGYQMPRTAAFVAACNPSGHGWKVRSNDEAQHTRFIPLAFVPTHQSFIQNLIAQGAHKAAILFAERHSGTFKTVSAADLLPVERYINRRNYTAFALLLDVFEHDRDAMTEVMFSMFGPTVAANWETLLAGDLPLGPTEIIGLNAADIRNGLEGSSPAKAWKEARGVLKQYAQERRTDLIAVSIQQLVHYLNQPNQQVSDDQVQVIGDLGAMLYETPGAKEHAMNLIRGLVMEKSPRVQFYRSKLLSWNASGTSSNQSLIKMLSEIGVQQKRIAADVAAST